MADEQKLKTFMERHGVRKEVAHQYLSANNWALDIASNKYESEVGTTDKVSKSSEKNAMSKEPEEQEKTEKSADEPLTESSHLELRDANSDGYHVEPSENSSILEPPSSKCVIIDKTAVAVTTNDSDPSLVVWGQGIRLGSAHPILPPPVRIATEDSDLEPTDDEHTIVVLHLWSEGFSLDDGTLRPYAVPENERFLRAVLRGDYPEEMLDNRPRVELSVQDHTNEQYRNLSRKLFLGPGRSLMSPSPRLALPVPGSQVAAQDVQVNEGLPVTTVQLRLADGSRIAARFNVTHNIADLYRYVRLASPQFSVRDFTLITAFPRQELQEADTRTLEQANLCNVVVIQHMSEEQTSSDSSELLVK